MKTTRRILRLKEKNVGMKLDAVLVDAIDRDAEREGLTRSAIIRRILKRNYASTVVPA